MLVYLLEAWIGLVLVKIASGIDSLAIIKIHVAELTFDQIFIVKSEISGQREFSH